MQIIDLKLDEIVIDEDLDFRTNGEDVTELAASIESHGLMQPITVAPPNGDGKHHIVAGRRRLRAYRELGRDTIPAIVKDDLTDESAQIVGQIIENLHREDVTAIDEARQFSQLLTYDLKQKDIATLVGCSPAHVSGRLALLKLDSKVVDRVMRGTISQEVATKLARMPKAVRDVVSKQHTIDMRAIASAEADYKAAKELDDVVAAFEDAGLKAGRHPDAWGYMKDESKAEIIGLTDDDKPKTHSWDSIGMLHSMHFDSTDDLIAEAVKAKPKGVFISKAGGQFAVTLLGSANLDLEAKKRREEQEAKVEAMKAEEAKRNEAWEKALKPIIASPDKGSFITSLLVGRLTDVCKSHHHLNITVIETALRRLDIEYVGHDAGETDSEYGDRLWAQLLDFATKSSTNGIRACLATAPTGARCPDRLLYDQGILDSFDPSLLDEFYQHQVYETYGIDVDRLSPTVAEEIREDEAERDKEEAFEEAVRVAIAAAQEDSDEPVSAEEEAAIREEVAASMADADAA